MSVAREITATPAFHRCDPHPSRNYGIGSVRLHWTLRKGGCAISWEIGTGWGLPDEEFRAANPGCDHPMHRHGYPAGGGEPYAGPVVWHMNRPTRGYMVGSERDCSLTDGGKCWGDIGFLIGDEVFKRLRVGGSDAAWAYLEELLDDFTKEEDDGQG